MKPISIQDIDRLLDGDCSAAEQKQLLEALPGHPELEAYYLASLQLQEDLAGQQATIPDESFSRSMVTLLQAEVQKQQRSWWQRIDRRPLTFSLLLLVMLGLAFYYLPLGAIGQVEMQGVPISTLLPGSPSLSDMEVPWGSLQTMSIAMLCLVLWLFLDKLIRPLFLSNSKT